MEETLQSKYPILKFFAFEHLPERLQKLSSPFALLAAKVAIEGVNPAETAACLRKLLEAKDCAVRAAL